MIGRDRGLQRLGRIEDEMLLEGEDEIGKPFPKPLRLSDSEGIRDDRERD